MGTNLQRRLSSNDLAQIAVFAALIAALGLVPGIYIFSAVPVTLQTLAVMLAGALLGARKGFFAVLLFLVLVAVGLPLLAGGRGGIAVFAGPTAGYLYGWLLGVVVIGLLTWRILPRYPLIPAIIVTLIGGLITIHLAGIIWLSWRAGLPAALATDSTFIIGDVIKVIVTVLIAKQVHRAWPKLHRGANSGRTKIALATQRLDEKQ